MHPLVLVLATALATAEKPSSPDVCSGAARTPAGVAVNAEEAVALEAKVAKDPNDSASRALLISHYARSTREPSARAKGLPHLKWLISHCPRTELLASPVAGPMLVREDSEYQPLRALWLEQVEKYPNDSRVLLNAAGFLRIRDDATKLSLLERATAADPTCARCWSELGHAYELGASKASDAERTAANGKALAAHERALAAGSDEDRFADLPTVARVALAAGETQKAERYAREMLAMAGKQPDHWNEGNLVHHGNLILGRVALSQGKTAEAKDYLLAAGRTKGSPQLGSFGPNMALARELLAAGEQQAVLEYFELCGKFWTRGQGKLSAWTSEVKDGKTPNFGASLQY